MVKQNWRYLLFLIGSHHPPGRLHRTIRVSFMGKNVYLCSRCTGTSLGIIGVFVANAFGMSFPIEFYLPLISFLPVVAAVDWFTQSAKLRESKNSIRVASGFGDECGALSIKSLAGGGTAQQRKRLVVPLHSEALYLVPREALAHHSALSTGHGAATCPVRHDDSISNGGSDGDSPIRCCSSRR